LCALCACGGADSRVASRVRQSGRVAVAAPLSRTLLVTAHDYAFSGVPSTLPAGWISLRMVNAGTQPHMLAIARLKGAMTATAAMDSLLRNPYWADVVDWSGPNVESAGDTETVSERLTPGAYIYGCFVEAPDGAPHIMKGMLGGFQVTAAADSGSPARADAVVKLADYHIDLAGSLRAGANSIRVFNTSATRHDLEIIKLMPGHSEAEALDWFEHPGKRLTAAQAIGGISALAQGQQAVLTADIAPGRYLLICWMETKGKPHFTLGMKQLVVVPA
jgi:hypothetical protein